MANVPPAWEEEKRALQAQLDAYAAQTSSLKKKNAHLKRKIDDLREDYAVVLALAQQRAREQEAERQRGGHATGTPTPLSAPPPPASSSSSSSSSSAAAIAEAVPVVQDGADTRAGAGARAEAGAGAGTGTGTMEAARENASVPASAPPTAYAPSASVPTPSAAAPGVASPAVAPAAQAAEAAAAAAAPAPAPADISPILSPTTRSTQHRRRSDAIPLRTARTGTQLSLPPPALPPGYVDENLVEADSERDEGNRKARGGKKADGGGGGGGGGGVGGSKAGERPFDFGASQKDDTLIREMQQQPLRPTHPQHDQHHQDNEYNQEPAPRPPRVPYVSAFGKGLFVPERPPVDERPAKVLEVVRGKEAREALPGYTCPECFKFFECMIEQGLYKREDLPTVLRDCSRHKGQHAPTDTPEEVWGLSVRTPDAWRAQDDEGRKKAKGGPPS